MIKPIRHLCFIALFCISAVASAQGFQPSQAQIEQFKNLSPQQQRQIAESMGIDVDALIRQQTQQSSSITEPAGNGRGRGRQQAQGEQTGQQMGMPQQGMYPGMGMLQTQPGMPLIPEEIRKLQMDYLMLEQDVFDKVFTRTYAQLPWQTFLDLYKQVTGLDFERKDELKPFGYDLFALSPDAFAPPSDSPVPADYVIGPGDTLVVQLYGKENNTYHFSVSRDGQIQFPNIGPLNVAGLTFKDAQNLIANTVNEQMIGVKSSVTMGPLRTIRVFVLGEAIQPGSYTVSSLSTMTNALFASGGITRAGSLRNIQLKRQGKVVTTLDVYDLLLEGDTSKDSRLLPGDVIFVPPVGNVVAVKGEVKRPAIYELKNETTAAEAVKLAGGLTSRAYPELTRLERVNEKGEISLIPLDLSAARGKKFPVRNADSLEISPVLDELDSAITLEGHVKRPGTYAWREDFRFSDLVRSVDALQSNPDLDAALIKREVQNTKQIEIHVFSPREAWANRGGADDPLLQKKDTLYIFDYETDRTVALEEVVHDLQVQSRYQEREKLVSIVGSVRFPGSYPLAEGMTAEELIQLAGGLTESALGTNAELTRYDVNDELERVVVHLSVDLTDAQALLQPADTLRVKQIPLWQEKETVEITGEVTYPGTYTISPGETLTDVLERAGGLTRHAYPRGALFSRADLRELERERLLDLRDKLEADIAASNLQDQMATKEVNEKEANRLLENLENVEAVGRMVIDLPSILRKPAAYDFQLEDGDRLTIPRYKPSVTVVGEVQYPTSHFYDRKLDVFEYISRSGGPKLNADKARIYIVKANGQVVLPQKSAWFRRASGNIEPGDTIVVPVDTNRVDRLTVWSSVTQIMYQAALGIAAISSL
jgi:polysaccharide export outer membrane protein